MKFIIEYNQILGENHSIRPPFIFIFEAKLELNFQNETLFRNSLKSLNKKASQGARRWGDKQSSII
ncbi:hypothetical protein AND4_01083 [Vibrio sp. AND4]|nr:hypothetical protein AND4_01083 [Vibrio sp. AND4]